MNAKMQNCFRLHMIIIMIGGNEMLKNGGKSRGTKKPL
jgi:hypothetical protein